MYSLFSYFQNIKVRILRIKINNSLYIKEDK